MNVSPYIKLIRPSQWVKNALLFFPPFLNGDLLQPGMLSRSVFPLFSFCFASSSVYILNDIFDAQNDSQHPFKKFRPIPAGEIKIRFASLLGVFLLFSAIAIGYRVSSFFLICLIAYLVINTAYSIKLKEYVILDLFCISAGFLLRLQAGGEAFGVVLSNWLFLSVFLLSLFLSTGKRLAEKKNLGINAGIHRKSLIDYPDGFLDGTMNMTGAAVLVTYTMYILERHTLLSTIPLCTYGILRYTLRVKSGVDGDPTESLLKDPQLFSVSLLWVIMIGLNIYG